MAVANKRNEDDEDDNENLEFSMEVVVVVVATKDKMDVKAVWEGRFQIMKESVCERW